MKPLFQITNPDPKYLIIDFANLVWRVTTVKTNTVFARKDGYPTSHLFLFARSIIALLKQYPQHTPLFVLEGSTANRRKVFPEYKGQRLHDPEAFDPFPDLLPLLTFMTSAVAYNSDYEADDVIYSIVTNFPGRHVVVSTDKDLWSLLSKAVVVNGSKGELKLEQVQKAFGECPLESIALYKAIYGDPSDNIPPIKGLRWAQVLPWLQHCATPTDLQAGLNAAIASGLNITEGKLLANIELIHNRYLVTQLNLVNYQLITYPGLPNELRNWLEKYEITSLLPEVPRLARPEN
jgi:5'-3' exonuclease